MVAGSAAYVKYSKLMELNGIDDLMEFDIFLLILILALGTGLVAFIGCVGALRENIFCLKIVTLKHYFMGFSIVLLLQYFYLRN